MSKFYRNIYPHVKVVNQLYSQANKIIIFDTETMGLEDNAKIIQFAGILYEKQADDTLKELEHYNTYIHPEETIPKEITDLTGITDQMVALAPTEQQIAPSIAHFLGKADIWCAYNSPFDLAKINFMMQRTHTFYVEAPCIDALIMARNVIPKDQIKNHKLASVVQTLCPGFEAKYHDAFEDVRATKEILEKLVQIYEIIEPPTGHNQRLPISGARFFINPRMQSMRRLKLLSNGKDTGIFWDCGKGGWSCKTGNKQLQTLFEQTDFNQVEHDLLALYYPKYEASNMDDLARQWGYDYYQSHKEKLKNQKISTTISQPELTQDFGIEIN